MSAITIRRQVVSPRPSFQFMVFACLAAALIALGASSPPAFAQYHSGSDGSNGPFPPLPVGQKAIPATAYYIVWNMSTGLVRYCDGYDQANQPETCTNELATAQIPGIPAGGIKDGVFNFTEFNVQKPAANPLYIYIYVVGDAYNVPLTILSENDVRLGSNVSLFLSGQNGKAGAQPWSPGVGGRGGPGGFPGGAGGNGGDQPSNGNPGFGPVGGAGGVSNGATADDLVGKAAATSPGTLSLTPLVAGSGGGGGAGVQSDHPLGCGINTFGFGGGGGGGGGGAVLFAAENTVEFTGGNYYITAGVYVNGGSGSAGGSSCVAIRGGGGEAGNIRIVGRTFTGAAALNLTGGYDNQTGLYAPGGRVRIEAFANTFAGTFPGLRQGSFIAFPLAPIPEDLPTLKIVSIGGIAVPAEPMNDLQNVDVNFPTPPENQAIVELSGHGIPLGTTAAIRVTPTVGAPSTATSTGFAGTVPSSTASAQVPIPPGYGSLNAVAIWTVTVATLKQMKIRGVPTAEGEAPARMEVVASAGAPARLYVVTNKGRYFTIDPSGEAKLR